LVSVIGNVHKVEGNSDKNYAEEPVSYLELNKLIAVKESKGEKEIAKNHK